MNCRSCRVAKWEAAKVCEINSAWHDWIGQGRNTEDASSRANEAFLFITYSVGSMYE